jgi:hypothetical protein
LRKGTKFGRPTALDASQRRAQGMAGRNPAGARELGADRERVDAEAHQIVDEQEQTADSGGKL